MSAPTGASETSAAEPRPARIRFGLYLLVIILLYVSDLITGVWVLFSGLQLPTADVSLSSLFFWFGAWALCYFGYRRSKKLGIALIVSTTVLTVLIVALVFAVALFFGMTSET